MLEAGFRPPSSLSLDFLESKGSFIEIGSHSNPKRYRVTQKRFGSGLVKLPLDDVCIETPDFIRLTGPKTFGQIWGTPFYMDKGVLPFKTDANPYQGTCLHKGDYVQPGTRLLLVVNPKHIVPELVQQKFKNWLLEGTCGPALPKGTLQVYSATVPTATDTNYPDARKFLQDICSVTITDTPLDPDVLWPPSLTASGIVEPLTSAPVAMIVSTQGNGRLIMSRSEDVHIPEVEVDILQEHNGRGLIRIESVQGGTLLANEQSVGLSTVLIWSDGAQKALKPAPSSLGPSISESNYHLSVSSSSPLLIEMTDSHGVTTTRLDANRQGVEVDLHSKQTLRVFTPLSRQAGQYQNGTLLFERLAGNPANTSASKTPSKNSLSKRAMLKRLNLSPSKQRALRKQESDAQERLPYSKAKALIRGGSL
jgi:hypothetical protein